MKRDFVSGVIWRAGGQIGRQVSTVLFGMLLARMLGPEAFGVITMATVFISFIALVDDLGIGAALVRVDEANFGDKERSTVLWFALGLGSALGLLCALSGVLLSRFYNEPALPSVVAVLSLGFPLRALAMVHNVVLVRALRFRTISRIEFVNVLVGGAAGLFCAWRGGGLWALVAQTLVSMVCNCIQHWTAVHFRPRLMFDREALSGLVRFGMYLVASEVVGFVGRNVDNVLIGRLFGASPLALYSRAYSFLYLELYGVRTVVSVLYPTLVGMKDDLTRARRAFLRVAGVVTLVTWPCALGLALVADPFVRTGFGASWVGMVPLVRALAPVAVWQALTSLQGLLFQLADRTDLQLRTVVISNVICIAGMVAGLYWGVLGLAIGYAVASLVSAIVTLKLALALIESSVLELLREVRGVAVCCVPLAMGASASCVLLQRLPPWLQLVAAAAAGAACFALSVLAVRPAAWQHCLEALTALRTQPSRPAPDALRGV
jgi:O-antigen/teichoic acid export membrane protein